MTEEKSRVFVFTENYAAGRTIADPILESKFAELEVSDHSNYSTISAFATIPDGRKIAVYFLAKFDCMIEQLPVPIAELFAHIITKCDYGDCNKTQLVLHDDCPSGNPADEPYSAVLIFDVVESLEIVDKTKCLEFAALGNELGKPEYVRSESPFLENFITLGIVQQIMEEFNIVVQ